MQEGELIMASKEDVGLNVKNIRKKRGLKQIELVKKMNPSPISVNTLSRIETGRSNYTVDLLFRIADVLSCDVSDFFQVKEQQPLKITIVEGDPKDLIKKIVKEEISKVSARK
jgi:transcriptional regulator with XRE-family HTH domain